MSITLNERQESELKLLYDQLNLWQEKSKKVDKYYSARYGRIISNLIYELE